VASIQRSRAGFRVFYARDGKRCASPTCPTREAAESWMREHLATLSARTVIDLAGIWEREAPSPHRTEAALRIVEAARIRGWGSVEGLTASELTAWQRASSPRYGQYVRTLVRWAAARHFLAVRAEVLAWRPPTYRRKAPAALLTDAQAAAIRAAARAYGASAAALIDYLLTYGARPITACQLLRSDLDLTRGELVIRHAKASGGWRHAVLDEHVETWRNLGGSDSDPLFPHPRPDAHGQPRAWRIERGSAREVCNWYKNTIGKRLKLGPLDGIYHLKRYAITKLLRAGVDPATVALFTGHLDLSQVMRYARSNPDVQRSALALLGRNTDRNAVTRPDAVSLVTP